MSRGSIHILGGNQNLTVNIDQIFGQGGSNGPSIGIPFRIEFRDFERNRGQVFSRADIISIKGELKIEDVVCGENVMLNTRRIAPKSNFETHVQFNLSDEIIAKIEKRRNSDASVYLGITIQVSVYEDIHFTDNQARSFMTSIETGFGYITFEIPQSHWVKAILPKLGHPSFRLIELPAANNLIPEDYSKSLVELEEATKYFLNGDYDKTVAHCRSALDPFKARKGEIKAFVTSKSEFAWANDVMEATVENPGKLPPCFRFKQVPAVHS